MDTKRFDLADWQRRLKLASGDELLAHHGLVVGSSRHGDDDPRLVDISPVFDAAVG